jgi:RNA polymerase sigma-70 factor, ECF subfamily
MSSINANNAPDNSLAAIWNDPMLIELRRDLLRFAFLQLRNHEIAEDVVQEALAAAYSNNDRFKHHCSIKTWVFTILKNKIIDVFRDRWNKNRFDLMEATGDSSDFDVLFKENDHWNKSDKPSVWGNPEQTLENKEFWIIFEICMNNMPEATGRVFAMRELLGLEIDDICKELAITTSNCGVILHRARMSLRLCLQHRWFEEHGIQGRS